MANKQYYRLFPVLWDSIPGRYSATVYGIDRMPDGPLAKFVSCTPRCKEDPAWWWAGPTYFRLVMPAGITGCCMGPQDIKDAVVWAQLPSWISWAMSQGYSFGDNFSFAEISPSNDITLIYN